MQSKPIPCSKLSRFSRSWIRRRLYHTLPLTVFDDRPSARSGRQPFKVVLNTNRGQVRRKFWRQQRRKVARRNRRCVHPEAFFRDGFDFSAYRYHRHRVTRRYPREFVLGTTYRKARYVVDLRYPLTVIRDDKRVESRHGVYATRTIGRWAQRGLVSTYDRRT